MGAFGLVVGVIFLAVAREARDRDKAALTDRDYDDIAPGGSAMPAHGMPESPHPPLGPALSRKVRAIALALACRDFSGIASLTLTSVYLQKARGLDARQAGFILGAMMLITIVINPLSVWLSPGRRRLPALAAVLIVGGAIIATAPFWPVNWVLPVLCAFQACHLGSYAISDAAIMERVDPNVRGRVVGLFLTVAGTIASTSPWVMGAWTDALGSRASEPTAYAGPFGLVGFLIALASVCTLVIARLGKAPEGRQIQPMSETMPATVEPVG